MCNYSSINITSKKKGMISENCEAVCLLLNFLKVYIFIQSEKKKLSSRNKYLFCFSSGDDLSLRNNTTEQFSFLLYFVLFLKIFNDLCDNIL